MAQVEAQSTLTGAETACLRRAGEGLSYKEIALELHCRPPTVDTHLKAARRKLGVSSTRAAARAYFGSDRLPKSSGPDPFGSPISPEIDAPAVQQPSAAEPVPSFALPPLQPTTLAREQEQDDTDDLTPWQKTLRIAAIAIGAAVAAGATLPGTLLLLHALQTLHGSR